MSSQQHLSKALHSAGFDIAHPFPVDALSESSMEMLSGIFKAKIPRCGVLIGNTSLVWSAFVLWLKQQPQWHQLNHPLNTFVEEHIQAHCRTCLPSAHILWTHQTGSYVVPIQRIAHESGFAFLSRGQFNVHPQYGPWFALRALLLVDEEPPAPKASVDPSASKTELKAHRMFQQLCAHM